MKPVSPTLLALLRSQQRFLIGELYTFTMASGSTDHFTDLDLDIVYGGNTFKSNSLRFDSLKYKTSVGLQVDEQDLKISAYPGETLGGAVFFEGLIAGLLDGATLLRSRAFWAVNTGVAALDYQQAPVGVVDLFLGDVSTITRLGRTNAEIKIKSPLRLLDLDMPRNTYEPGCQWTLFDNSLETGVPGVGCTLLASSFAFSGTVLSASTSSITVVGGVSPVTGGDGIPYYVQGRIKFTSGAQNGLLTVIASNNSTDFAFNNPPIDNLAPGDTFVAYPGCAKTGRGGACELKFNNLPNFRGFPRVPPISVSV